mgnify:CR=1 FL=1
MQSMTQTFRYFLLLAHSNSQMHFYRLLCPRRIWVPISLHAALEVVYRNCNFKKSRNFAEYWYWLRCFGGDWRWGVEPCNVAAMEENLWHFSVRFSAIFGVFILSGVTWTRHLFRANVAIPPCEVIVTQWENAINPKYVTFL